MSGRFVRLNETDRQQISFLVDGELVADKSRLAAALENLSRYLAVQLGPLGVRCNCILPGGTLVKPENTDFFTKENPITELLEEIRPIRKIGDAKDVAYLVEFLCSNKASFISGQSIFVDGGLHAVSQESLARRLNDMLHPNDLANHLHEK